MIDLIAFGAINLDEVYSARSSRLPEELRVVSGSEWTVGRKEYERLTRTMGRAADEQLVSGGGQAANSVYALARMGFKTAIISGIGDDPEGRYLLSGLYPVDTTQVAVSGRTARCVVILEDGEERTMRVLPGSGSRTSCPIRAWDALGGARYLHLTSLAPAERLTLQVQLVQHIPRQVKVSFDPNELYCRLGLEKLSPLLKRADVLFINEREAELLTGSPNLERWDQLSSFDIPVLVCKKGRRGSEIVAGKERFSVPARDALPVDPTGAGDVFAGGFLAGLLLDADLRKCAELASRAAALSVSGYGSSTYPGPELLASVGLDSPMS